MRGNPSDPIEKARMADEGLRGLYWEENVQTHNNSRVPCAQFKKYNNPEEAFEGFMTLNFTRENMWNFISSQMQDTWDQKATHYSNARRQFHKTLPTGYQYVVMEHRRDGTISDFVCDRFPEKQYPVYVYKELYREVATDLTQLTQFWIDGHRPEVKRKLVEFLRKGMFIDCCFVFLNMKY